METIFLRVDPSFRSCRRCLTPPDPVEPSSSRVRSLPSLALARNSPSRSRSIAVRHRSRSRRPPGASGVSGPRTRRGSARRVRDVRGGAHLSHAVRGSCSTSTVRCGVRAEVGPWASSRDLSGDELCKLAFSSSRYPVIASVAYRWLALCLMTTPAPNLGDCRALFVRRFAHPRVPYRRRRRTRRAAFVRPLDVCTTQRGGYATKRVLRHGRPRALRGVDRPPGDRVAIRAPRLVRQ